MAATPRHDRFGPSKPSVEPTSNRPPATEPRRGGLRGGAKRLAVPSAVRRATAVRVQRMCLGRRCLARIEGRRRMRADHSGSTRKEHSTPAGRRIRSLAYPSSIDHSPSRIDPAFAYFRLGTEQHGNLPTWREALALQAERLRDAMPDGRTLDADAHFALVAIRQGLRLVEVVQSYVDDEALGRALDEHDEEFADARNLRDVATHLDEYIFDLGRLQKRGAVDPGVPSWRHVVDGDLVIVYPPFAVPVLAACERASRVIALAEDVWLQGLRDGIDGLESDDDPCH